jgi:cytochrome c oxidase cbb3-type subunit I/II
VWKNAKCYECHGQNGEGNGEKVESLKDDLGFPMRPANLTSGQFKSGPAVEDIFRTISTGLSGTPMPSFKDSLADGDRWALAYYILSLSAFKDPLTGEPLKISDATKKALDNPSLDASTPDTAYVPPEVGSHSAAAADMASTEQARVLVNIGADAVPQKSESVP